MTDEFADLTRGEIARKFISHQQKVLLEEFFGTGLKGAEFRLANFIVPDAIEIESLEAYGEIARRTIEEKLDKQGVQALRLHLVEMALTEIKR